MLIPNNRLLYTGKKETLDLELLYQLVVINAALLKRVQGSVVDPSFGFPLNGVLIFTESATRVCYAFLQSFTSGRLSWFWHAATPYRLSMS